MDEWTTTASPEALIESLRPRANADDLRRLSVALCHRIDSHLSAECLDALQIASDVADGRADQTRRQEAYAAVNNQCFYVDGDSSSEDRLTGFAPEAVLSTLFGENDVPCIRNYAATCAIAASRAVVEVVLAAAELRGCSAEEVERIVDEERRSHCEHIRSMFSTPDR